MIKSQSSSVFDDLDELNKTKDVILDEIEELKRQLEKKYSELDTLNKQIESKEIEIDAIKSNFNHEFNKINFKKRHYEESLKDYNDQQDQYENMIKLYDKDDLKYDEKLKNYKKTIMDLETEINNFQSISVGLNTELSKRENLLKQENEVNTKISLIVTRLDRTNRNKNKNLEEIQYLEVNNKRLESEIVAIDLRIPTLEEEKKSYVSQKNFKEAGRVSNELKSLLENKTKNITKIDENKINIQELSLENESVCVIYLYIAKQ